jgi:large subunit ribosomal protein L13
MKSQKLTLPKNITRAWYELDASSQSMGRVATQIATILRGKHKRDFTPHMDMGDFVVALNVDNLKFTGRKLEQKKYYRHTGYMGGIRTKTLKDEIVKNPDQVLRRAVFSMLDDVKFRKAMISRLRFVTGSKHDYKIDKKLT